ncbi:MAG: PepSY-associated TM helix domain-containing protein [Bacteroidota bacterium]
MKFQQLPPRIHHILFHTHTVSGIVISFALFIIFYAGAFALFREDMFRWEEPAARHVNYEKYSLDKSMQVLRQEYPILDSMRDFSLVPPSHHTPLLLFNGSYVDTAGVRQRVRAYVNPETYEITEHRTTAANTIYGLHFFTQIPGRIGIYIAGFVALFFLFATITGVLIHWKDIAKKFYAFSPKTTIKQVWKNSHTVLGLLGLPFYIMYGITGSLLGLSILLLIPSALILFEGDQDKIVNIIRPQFAIKVDEKSPVVDNYSLDARVSQFTSDYGYEDIHFVFIRNYGKEDATILFSVDNHETLTGEGSVVYSLQTGKELLNLLPENQGYSIQALPVLIKLHYVTYGGLALKVIYFFFAMLTCFMIMSGVLLWHKARDNVKYTNKQRRFNFQVTRYYLAICFSLFPSVALIFLANKLIPMDAVGRMTQVETVFFTGWLLLFVVAAWQKEFSRIAKFCLLTGGGFSLLVPVLNGIMTCDWLWTTIQADEFQVFGMDMFWLITAITAFLIAIRVKFGKELMPEKEKAEVVAKPAGEERRKKSALLDSTQKM